MAPAPTTTSSEAPVVVEPTTSTVEPTTSTTEAAATYAATTAADSGSDSSSDSSSTASSANTLSGTSFSGKITWIGDTTGAYSACGAPYEGNSMFVAVNPNVLDCGSGTGVKMSVTANGKTVSAYAVDKCMGCTTDHIDVATAVYEALGYTTDDGGMHDTSGISWVISQI